MAAHTILVIKSTIILRYLLLNHAQFHALSTFNTLRSKHIYLPIRIYIDEICIADLIWQYQRHITCLSQCVHYTYSAPTRKFVLEKPPFSLYRWQCARMFFILVYIYRNVHPSETTPFESETFTP